MASTTVAPETPVRGPDGGPSAGSLTELAALEAARDEKRHLLRLLDKLVESPTS